MQSASFESSVVEKTSRLNQTLTGVVTGRLGDQYQQALSRRANTRVKKKQVIALSSAGSEMYDRVRTAYAGIGVQNIAMDMGECVVSTCPLTHQPRWPIAKVLARLNMSTCDTCGYG